MWDDKRQQFGLQRGRRANCWNVIRWLVGVSLSCAMCIIRALGLKNKPVFRVFWFICNKFFLIKPQNRMLCEHMLPHFYGNHDQTRQP